MSNKKANKKLRELARLQSLHGGVTSPVAAMGSAPAMAGATPSYIPSSKVNHLHTELVKKDLRDLAGLMVLMVVLLIGMYWLVANTSFATWLLSLGRHIS